VKSFWGNSQNAVKTQIYIAIIGYYALIDPSYTLQIDPPKLTALF
jgi:hypothetical protein